MRAPDWLTARPVAHRGLHDEARGIIENMAAAAAAAIAGNFAIECDIQLSADGEAMVHHDDALGRLTDGSGRLDALTAAELRRVPFKATADRMLTLGELCALELLDAADVRFGRAGPHGAADQRTGEIGPAAGSQRSPHVFKQVNGLEPSD